MNFTTVAKQLFLLNAAIVYEWKKWGTGGPCFYSQRQYLIIVTNDSTINILKQFYQLPQKGVKTTSY